VSELDSDPVVHDLRDQITANDREIVAAVNRRIELVTRLKQHKEAHGYPLIDRAREDWLVEHLAVSNAGPLSPAGLRRLVGALIDLTKRETALPGDDQ
jgi:chorismate mutase